MIKQKRAQMETVLNYVVFRIPIVIIVVVFFMMILRTPYTQGLNSYEIENLILIKRLTYSPNVLAYEDPDTGRVFPGIIDYSKFNTDLIEESLPYKSNRIAANLKLTNLETGEEDIVYVNQERARAWDDWALVDGFDSSVLRRYVKIYKEGEFYPGVLRIKVLIRT